MGPILAAMNAAPRTTATAAKPAPWPRELSQHDGLHMTDRLCVGSVDHATHLFLDGFREGCRVACRGWRGTSPPGPAPACLGQGPVSGRSVRGRSSKTLPSMSR